MYIPDECTCRDLYIKLYPAALYRLVFGLLFAASNHIACDQTICSVHCLECFVLMYAESLVFNHCLVTAVKKRVYSPEHAMSYACTSPAST